MRIIKVKHTEIVLQGVVGFAGLSLTPAEDGATQEWVHKLLVAIATTRLDFCTSPSELKEDPELEKLCTSKAQWAELMNEFVTWSMAISQDQNELGTWFEDMSASDDGSFSVVYGNDLDGSGQRNLADEFGRFLIDKGVLSARFREPYKQTPWLKGSLERR